MLIVRYFMWVGGALLVLLFIADSQLPRVDARDQPERTYNIRVKSSVDRPDPVTFAGHAVSYAAAPTLEVIDFARRTAEAKADAKAAAEAQKAFAKASAAEVLPEAAETPAPRRPRKQFVRRTYEQPAEPPRYVEARRSGWRSFQ